ncbi:hypothetical protein AB0E59_35995 [Lentzea sp. NPDC034063]|uniref:hypothetical protein n=1 Tax=unclassified Lentzea TaxID=2643253 RepID=UPI00340DEBE1
MPAEVANAEEHVLEVTNGLAAEFSETISKPIVSRTVLEARRDLEGQIVPEALGEMLHHLARHRLTTLRAARKSLARSMRGS